ncbi:hypothetical protein DFH11DRAFT_1725874 [Phellopilus nigrolimitatus]|nr:hypothetical protein DFH11DRAFT_1725874 [Phellopilus nigrolimitatus]
MASVIVSPERDTDRRTSKDLPHLSLSLDSPPNASPFPSPSSSFLPPPMPGPHEFANKLAIPASKKKQRDSTESLAAATAASAGVNGLAHDTAIPPPAAESAVESPSQTPQPSKRSSLAAPVADAEPNTPVHAKHASLSSSRPAPPSPSVSRRTSGAPSCSLSRVPSSVTRRSSTTVTTSTGITTSAASPAQRRSARSIKIRDFAYPVADLRHTGQGPDAPRLGRSRAPSEYDENGSSRRNSGWGAFRWAGSKLWGFALGGGGKRQSEGDGNGFVPTKSDFERNFDMSSPTDEYSPADYVDADSQDDDDDDEGYHDTVQDTDLDAPLHPGLYRAAYAFVPEGTAEMALVEDQLVRVIGRGGGVGWAIAEDESGGHALVPESYLEVVELDDSSVDSSIDSSLDSSADSD